ncbi:cytochrome C [Noviherbaspirillum sp. DKR-6]|uniref:Cytochrome C n=2 Tax=Noviherbaspirillum pedocola TaxID=2801341 RepID=A0A934T001_9BURK|nr:cytochrome C [Noviherbaspirillum pedocola]
MRTRMRTNRAAALAALLSMLCLDAGAAGGSIERGRYLAKIGGCNDCHTPGYGLSGGQVPEAQWLVGDQIGWNGPWGTTYPSNLRLYFQKVSESEWLKAAREKQLRPPMPWFALRDMSDEDLVSLHRFIRTLGPAGEPAPAYLPPGVEPQGPAIRFPQPPS